MQVTTYITPSGEKVFSKAGTDRGLIKSKVPFFLASHWNRCGLLGLFA
jgi:hypothetical protein